MINDIFITQVDKDKLLNLVDKAKDENTKSHRNLKKLESEINRAGVLNHESLTHKIISMNSKVVLQIDDELEEITLV